MSKTIAVSKVKELANSLLANKKLTDEERKGVAALLERVLFESDNYNGYGLVDWLEGGFQKWVADGQPTDNTAYLGNQTRRVYF